MRAAQRCARPSVEQLSVSGSRRGNGKPSPRSSARICSRSRNSGAKAFERSTQKVPSTMCWWQQCPSFNRPLGRMRNAPSLGSKGYRSIFEVRDVGAPRGVDDRLRIARQRQRHGQAREGKHVLRERRRVLRCGDIPIERAPAVAKQQQRQVRRPFADLERLEFEQRHDAPALFLEPPFGVRDTMAREALQQQRRAHVAVGDQHAGVGAGRRRGKRRRVGDNAGRRQRAAQPERQLLPVRRKRLELGRLQLELAERHRVCRVAVVPGVEAGIEGLHGIPASLCVCRLSRQCGCARQ